MQRTNESGFSLFEIIIAIAIFSVVGVSLAQIISVSLQSDRTAGQKTTALELAQETMSAINSIATSQWNDIYNLTKGGGTVYYPANTTELCGSVRWCVQSGNETVVIEGLTFARSFFLDNVSRTGTTIDTVYNSANDDPSTQKITVHVTWSDSASGTQLGSLSVNKYLTRSRNAIAEQVEWDDSPGGIPPTTGENGDFGTSVSSLDTASISTTTPASTLSLKAQ